MTDRTFTFTIEQIKQIYEAGISRGSSEEASFQCGSRATGCRYDDCVDAIHDIINDGKKWGEDGFVSLNEIDTWFK